MDCSNTFNSDCIGDSSDSSSEKIAVHRLTVTEYRLSEFHSVSDDHCDDDVGV